MGNFFGTVKEKVLNKVVQIGTEEILPNPHQPRRAFDSKELNQLAESIQQNGILQPLSLRRCGQEYELISGERRLRAARLAGFTHVPAIIIEVSERNSAVLALVENVQRQDLSFFDEAYAIEKLIDFYGMTQEDAAIKLGKAQSTVANKLRLLKFSAVEMAAISSGNLTERHARALLRLSAGEQRAVAIEKIVKNQLNVEKTELLIDMILDTHKERESLRKRSGVFKDVRLFVNTINRAVETMQAAGIQATSRKTHCEDYIEYVVRIPTNEAATVPQ